MELDPLFEKFIPKVDRWVRGYATKLGIRHEVDDLQGAANLRMVEVFNRFAPNILSNFAGNVDKFSVYLRLSVQTAMADYVRQQNRHDHLTLWRSDLICHSDDPVGLMEAERSILDAIKDSKDAQIVQARLEGARTAKEVSKKTGIPRNTVYRRLRLMRIRYDKQS